MTVSASELSEDDERVSKKVRWRAGGRRLAKNLLDENGVILVLL